VSTLAVGKGGMRPKADDSPMNSNLGVSSAPNKSIKASSILSLLAMVLLMFAGAMLKSAAPIYAGVPTFESLHVGAGVLVHGARKCSTSGRGLASLALDVNEADGLVRHAVPCAPALESALAGRSGLRIEVRSRPFSTYILNTPVQQVWSVTVDGVEVYRYSERARRQVESIQTYWVLLVSEGLFVLVAVAWAAYELRRR